MAKSNLDKLKDAIAESTTLLDQAEIGESGGQYPQQSVDVFKATVAAAEVLVSTEGAEPSQFDAQTTALNDARSSFLATRIPAVRKVTLRGTPSQRKGAHTIHFKNGVVNFVDGEAQLPDELADELADAGYVE
ncbi:hypothetical protein [Paenibacillus ottowii]|uniref:Uncharacterized protein n=1 Tax=Paenibacillus ottowii TaxID=2315729 RepID=A0ABY3B7K9_9BACL|nr:hypothetical protein [Paenibacillus ottowii]TQS00057.1 hypothetical protein FKV70_04550 [Paenibacillus ottowii]TQS00126.1 hypothetical protein FKV70_04925 [Paenibacillus ottowii]